MAGAARARQQKRCCLSLDLEPDCGGRLASLDALAETPRLCQMLRHIGVPVTVFVSGVIFEECPAAVEKTESGDVLEVDLETGEIINTSNGIKFSAEPYPRFMADLIAAGGLIEYTRQRLADRRL